MKVGKSIKRKYRYDVCGTITVGYRGFVSPSKIGQIRAAILRISNRFQEKGESVWDVSDGLAAYRDRYVESSHFSISLPDELKTKEHCLRLKRNIIEVARVLAERR
ncbi:MAG: hypothetical protein JWO73_606, partial [Candidatus Taylorbacteria bacterium]|nr:hypothetical protein [Candidatus Taylorbacteria bacterium]